MIAPDWHEARRRRVGCSELASVFSAELAEQGCPPRKGAWSLWHEKADPSAEATEDTGPTALGRLLEPVVLQLAEVQCGFPVIPWHRFEPTDDGRAMHAPATPFRIDLPADVHAVETRQGGARVYMLAHSSGLCGTLDAVGFPDDGGGPVVVDAKTCGMHALSAWRERDESGDWLDPELPAEYAMQGHGYLALTGLRRALFATFRVPPVSPTQLLLDLWVRRDPATCDAIVARVTAFVASLPSETSTGVPPRLDPVLDAEGAHRVFRSVETGRVIIADAQLEQLLAGIEAARAAARTATARAEGLFVEALPLIGTAEVVRFGARKATVQRAQSGRSLRFGQWRQAS